MRVLGLICLAAVIAAGSIIRECHRRATTSGIEGPATEIPETNSVAFQERQRVGCSCRQEVIDSDGVTSLWRCTYHYCGPGCYCNYASIGYEVHPIGKSPGACDAACSHIGCTEYTSETGTMSSGEVGSFKLAAAENAGGDDAIQFGVPLGPESENKHVASAASRDSWFVEVGGVRLRLFQLEIGRTDKNGQPVTKWIPVGYEVTAGPEKEGKVEFVRPVVATVFTGEKPTKAVVAGFYEVGARRRPGAPLEIYAVRTASDLKLDVP